MGREQKGRRRRGREVKGRERGGKVKGEGSGVQEGGNGSKWKRESGGTGDVKSSEEGCL